MRTAASTELIEGVPRDVEKLQAGGVHAIMFGNENDRPYRFTATPETIAAMTAVVMALKPSLKVPFGINYLWDPYASVAIACATGAAFVREIFTGLFASDMGLWQPNAANALTLRRNLGRPGPEALLQRQCRVRRLARHPPDRAPRQERRLLLARRCHPRLGPADRHGGRHLRPQAGPRSRRRHAGFRQHRRPHRQCARDLRDLRRLYHRHPFQGRRQHLEPGRGERVKRFMDVVAKLVMRRQFGG